MPVMMKAALNILMSIVVGGAATAMAHYGWGLPLIVGGAIGGALMILTLVGLGLEIKKPKTIRTVDGVSKKDVKEIINEGERKVSRLRQIGQTLTNRQAEDRVRRICETMDAIFDHFREDPRGVKSARPFLNFYLDRTLSMIEKYAELRQRYSDDSAEVGTIVKQFGAMLSEIEKLVENQKSKLQRQDISSLEEDMRVFQTLLEKEGL